MSSEYTAVEGEGDLCYCGNCGEELPSALLDNLNYCPTCKKILVNNHFREVTKMVGNIYSVGDHEKVYVYGSCPTCGAPVIQPDKYCSECGQKIGWEK